MGVRVEMGEEKHSPSNPLTQPFWEATRKHKFVMQRCSNCKRFHWLPVPRCQTCGGDLEWEELSGKGSVYTYTVVNRAVRNKLFADKVPYLVAMVELDEGPRFIAPVQTKDLEKVRIGTRVEVTFEDVDAETSLPRFKLV